MTERPRNTPDWLLERLAQNELTEQQKKMITADPQKLEALQRSNQEILAGYPPAQLVKEIQRRLARSAPQAQSKPRWVFALVPVAAAALVAFWVGRELITPPATTLSPIEDNVLIKGLTPKLQIYRKKGDKAERLAAKSTARPSDLLQLSYLAAGKPFGMIVSLDGRGVVTRHLPEEGDTAARLDQHGEILLPNSYELDDAPRFESFYFITSDEPFPVEAVLAAIGAVAKLPDPMATPLPLPKNLTQFWITIQKESL